MEALNYLPDALEDLKEWKHLLKESCPYSSLVIENLIPLLKSSERFILPENGKIFETNFHGLRDVYPRLPYPRIVIEYAAKETPKDKSVLLETEISSKRIIFAQEFDKETSTEMISFFNLGNIFQRESFLDGCIQIVCLDFYRHLKKWIPGYVGALIPYERGGEAKKR